MAALKAFPEGENGQKIFNNKTREFGAKLVE